MAFIIRRIGSTGKESPFWSAVYRFTDSAGRSIRKTKSTGQRNRKPAQRIADELETNARRLVEGRISATLARKALDQVISEVTGETLPRYSVKAWFKEWLSQKEGAAKPRSLDRYRYVLTRFTDHLGERAAMPLEAVTPTHVRQFRDAQKAAGKSAHTLNQDSKILGMPFRSAVKLGYLSRNPADALDRLQSDSESRQPFTLEQVQALIRGTEGEWRGLILLGLYTGARLGDAATMRWKHIDLEAKTIRYVPEKTDRRKKRDRELVLPLHPALETHLLTLPSSDDPEAFLFPTLALRRRQGRSGLSMEFGRKMEACGIVAPVLRAAREAKGEGKSIGRAMRGLTFHSLRHTLTSIMHNAGVAVEIRQKVTGHASEQMNAIYSHTDIATLRAALATVPDILNPEPTNDKATPKDHHRRHGRARHDHHAP